MKPMRAKMYVEKVVRHQAAPGQSCEEVHFRCVSDSKYGPNGESEDNTFARYSPSGELRITITNPALAGAFTPGEKTYVDFTPAE